MFKAQRQVEGTGKLLSFAVIVLLKRYFEENGAPERIRTLSGRYRRDGHPDVTGFPVRLSI